MGLGKKHEVERDVFFEMWITARPQRLCSLKTNRVSQRGGKKMKFEIDSKATVVLSDCSNFLRLFLIIFDPNFVKMIYSTFRCPQNSLKNASKICGTSQFEDIFSSMHQPGCTDYYSVTFIL